jgi:hypothetical protein
MKQISVALKTEFIGRMSTMEIMSSYLNTSGPRVLDGRLLMHVQTSRLRLASNA